MSEAEFEYLGPYRVDRVIGRGGMGSVYKGFHAKSGEPVAVKVIASGIANQTRFRRRFAAEVEALKRLKHPHIVELIGYGEEQGLLFYSMEYVEGHSLHEHLRQHEKLPWEEVIQVGIETTAALKHAHNLGIIHRDLKPANLMLSEAGKIKLTDFGIAKLFGSADETAAGSVIGTADYMPPEQAEGKPVTVRSDLYSLGCVLYALLAGQAPFGGKSVPEVLYAVRYNQPPDLASRAPDTPRELVELIHHLLEKDPQKRPPTALVVSNRLKSLQQGMRRNPRPSSDEKARKPQPDLSNPVGTQLTSLDLSDIDDDELKLTGDELNAMGLSQEKDSESKRGASGLGTHEQQTIVAPESLFGDDTDDADERPSVLDRKSEGRHSGAEPLSGEAQKSSESRKSSTRQKVASRDSADASFMAQTEDSEFHPMPSELLTSGGPSHYTPVSTSSDVTFSFGTPAAEKQVGTDWVQYGSMVAIIGLLVGSIGFAWYMLQPETADQVYQRIMVAVNSADDNRLLAANGDIDSFIARFPEDERIDEVQALADEAELIKRTKLLQRKGARAGGINELTAIEQAFLECMQARAKNFGLAQEKLLAFTKVFGQTKDLAPGDRRLVELAEFAIRVGENLAISADPVAKQQLEQLVASAERALSGGRLKSFYRDILLLYEEKPWAEEQLTRIRAKLEAIDGSTKDGE